MKKDLKRFSECSETLKGGVCKNTATYQVFNRVRKKDLLKRIERFERDNKSLEVRIKRIENELEEFTGYDGNPPFGAIGGYGSVITMYYDEPKKPKFQKLLDYLEIEEFEEEGFRKKN